MPSMKCTLVDHTQTLNWLTLIKGGYGTGVVTTIPAPTGGVAYSGSDVFPNCQSYTIQNVPKGNTGGYIFFSKKVPTPATGGVAFATGEGESMEAQNNSYPLSEFFIGSDTDNTIFTIEWNYT